MDTEEIKEVAPVPVEAQSRGTRRRTKDEVLLAWSAPEYPHHEKTSRWFIVALVIVGLLVIYGLMTDGWTFSVAMLVFAGTYYVTHRRAPPVVDVVVSRTGIKIGQHIFPYTQLKGFWVLFNPPSVHRLYIRVQGKFHPDIFVDIGESDPAEIATVLNKYLKEIKGMEEPFGDTVVRLLRL